MAISLKKDGFSFSEVEMVLAKLFGIHLDKRATFSARLQQLQRMGLPPGANPGRGTRFRYAYWQLAEFALYVDLLDCGVPPNLIKTHLGGSGFYSMMGVGELVEQAPATGTEGMHVFIELHTLNYLRSSSPDCDVHAADHVFKIRSGAGELLTEKGVTPTIVINLSKRLAELKSVVAELMSSHANDEVFPASPPSPGKVAI